MTDSSSFHKGVTLRSALVPFSLAGLALFALVLDEIEAPHDNVDGIVTLAAGAFAGVVFGAATLRLSKAPHFSQVVARAWDTVRYVLAFEMVRYGLAKAPRPAHSILSPSCTAA